MKEVVWDKDSFLITLQSHYKHDHLISLWQRLSMTTEPGPLPSDNYDKEKRPILEIF